MDKFILLSRESRGDWKIFSIGRPTDLEHFTFFVNFPANKAIIDRGKYFKQVDTDLKGMEIFFEENKIDHKEVFALRENDE